MPDFSYIARDATGEKITGTLVADGQREAMAVLAGRSLFPIKVTTDAPATADVRVRRVPAQLLANTYGQLADLLESGVPLLRAVQVLQEQTSHKGLKHILSQIHRQVEDGATMAEAMRRFEHIFGELAVSMISAGGEGGFLEEALARVAEFTEMAEDLKKRTIGAVIYPFLLAGFGMAIVTALIVFFVPKFDELFARLRERGELPAMTDWLLWLSNVSGTLGPFVAVATVAGIFAARWWLKTEDGRLWWDRLRIRVPIAGPIFLNLAVARFCRVLGTLLNNGVPILRSLEISSDATGNRVLAIAIQDATENISAGQTLAEPLGKSGQFPTTVVEILSVAEQSNNLEKVLLGIADSLERRTWRRLDLAVRLIEPLLLLVLAVIVLFVVIALLLPVMNMSQSI